MHEINFRDYPDAESIYKLPDSGGECGVPYWTYFPMPTVEKKKPWYSIEQGSVHFTIISTEHAWAENSEQVKNDTCSNSTYPPSSNIQFFSFSLSVI